MAGIHNSISIMPDTHVSFIETQTAFTDYIRDPENKEIPVGIKKERMEIYRELCFNNVNSFLTSNFPVLHHILSEHQWLDLAQKFFSRHACKSPYFTEIPEEFIHYLQFEREPNGTDPAFMLELAHYEWVEMVLSISKESTPAYDERIETDPLKHTLSLSPLAWPLAYQFPVHLISQEFQPKEPPQQPTFLVVYRHGDIDVKFMLITPVTFRLLQILQDEVKQPTELCLRQIAGEFNHLDSDTIMQNGASILKNLSEKRIIYIPD